MSTIGYYPGCSLGGTAKEYDRSLKAVAGRLGVELKEVPNWVCCGATSAHAIDHAMTLGLAADTLAKAGAAGMQKVLAPCAMCYQRLAAGVKEFGEKPELAAKVALAMGGANAEAMRRIEALNVLQWLGEIPEETIKAKISKPLKGKKVACYYGCLLVRPGKITGERNVESPRSMERFVEMLGAQTVRWPMAMECCGGSFALSRKRVVLRQGERIVESARKAGADLLCMACPMCQANLDMRQAEFSPGKEPLPSVYLTQLMAAAMGAGEEKLGFAGHFVPVKL